MSDVFPGRWGKGEHLAENSLAYGRTGSWKHI